MKPLVPPPLQLLIAGALMYTLSKQGTSAIEHWFPMISFSFDGQKELASFIIALGVVLAFSGIWAFKQAKTTTNPMQLEKASALVTSGIYRYTRNPMYLGLVIILIGFGIRLGSLLAFVVIPLFMWVMTQIQIKPEERVLRELFGEEYQVYMNKVRRWI